MAGKAEERDRSRSVAPLRRLWPFLRPYRGLLWAALAALVATSVLTLEPADRGAARRRQLLRRGLALVDAYFARRARHRGAARARHGGALLSRHHARRAGDRRHPPRRSTTGSIGLSPGFFERVMTGEVLSRLTTDTTLVLSVDRLVGLGGAAQRADARRRARRSCSGPARSSPRSSSSACRSCSCRSSTSAGGCARSRRESQDRIAESSAAGLREPARGADRAGLHPRGRRAGRPSAASSSAPTTRRGGGSARARR